MIGRGRVQLRGEEGLIGAGTVIGIGLVILFFYLLLAAFQGDTAKFGEVRVPGEAQLELPDGDVDIYYSEGVDPDSGVSLVVPEDLEVRVFDAADVSVPIESKGDSTKSTDDGLTQVIGSLQVPGDGIYRVEVDGEVNQQRVTPAVTFGEGPVASVKDRWNGVVDELKGPLGILLLIVLVVLFMLPRIRRARRRSSYKSD